MLQLVHKERKLMPRIGGRKLLHKIQEVLTGELYLGRDSFFDFLRAHGLLIKKRRYRVKTTNSNHWLRKYPNLIRDFIPTGSHQLWVSDITYIVTKDGFVYLSLITDAYSRKIIGWALGETLEAKHSVVALKMALKQLPKQERNIYHHSDRGAQYCCEEYVRILEKNDFQISMTENGDPLENAIAERVNGILKDEWLNLIKFKTIQEVEIELKKIIEIYNAQRPHCSIDMLTPEQAHDKEGTIKRTWKNYYKSKKEVDIQENNVTLKCPTKRWRHADPLLNSKNGRGIEPHSVFAQQNSSSTIPFVINRNY